MIVPVAGLVAATLIDRRPMAIVMKPAASAIFLIAGLSLAPFPRPEAVAFALALILSFAGDLLLIPRGRRLIFAVGLASFLCAHAAYGVAFVLRGTSLAGVAAGALVMAALGAPLARWLLPHVRGPLRGPVIGYIVAITAMVVLAGGAVVAGAHPTLLVGAALFYASDLCVARERFVVRARVHGAVGLPLYYAAQLLLIEGFSVG